MLESLKKQTGVYSIIYNLRINLHYDVIFLFNEIKIVQTKTHNAWFYFS